MAHAVMGLVRRSDNRLAEAQSELETAISLDRNNAFAFRQLGLQPELTIQYVEKALRISPRKALVPSYLFIGLSHLFVGRTDEAMGFLRKARAQNFRIWYARLTLAGALGLTGDLEEAHGEIAEALKLKPEITSIVKWRAYLMTTGHASAPWQALMDRTVYAGLRRAGFPDE